MITRLFLKNNIIIIIYGQKHYIMWKSHLSILSGSRDILNRLFLYIEPLLPHSRVPTFPSNLHTANREIEKNRFYLMTNTKSKFRHFASVFLSKIAHFQLIFFNIYFSIFLFFLFCFWKRRVQNELVNQIIFPVNIEMDFFFWSL